MGLNFKLFHCVKSVQIGSYFHTELFLYYLYTLVSAAFSDLPKQLVNLIVALSCTAALKYDLAISRDLKVDGCQ